MRATHPRSVPGQIPRRLAAGHRMGDQREIGEIEFIDEPSDIVGEGIVVIAAGWLIGTAAATPIKADAAEILHSRTRSFDSPTAATQAVEEKHRRALSPLAPI